MNLDQPTIVEVNESINIEVERQADALVSIVRVDKFDDGTERRTMTYLTTQQAAELADALWAAA